MRCECVLDAQESVVPCGSLVYAKGMVEPRSKVIGAEGEVRHEGRERAKVE